MKKKVPDSFWFRRCVIRRIRLNQLVYMVMAILASTASAQAKTDFKPQIGLGYTNNANFETTNTDDDFYWWTTLSLATDISTRGRLKASLSFHDYFSESQNDAVSWRLLTFWPKLFTALPKWETALYLGGKSYTQDSPGTTDEGYDSYYFGGTMTKWLEISSETEVSLEPGLQLKDYEGFGGREDLTLSFNSTLNWKATSTDVLNPYGEIGIVSSNQSLYRRNYIELGIDWERSLPQDLKFNLAFLTRGTGYPNRTVADQTVTARNRGVFKNVTRTTNEQQTYVQLSGSLTKTKNKIEYAGVVSLTSQKSRSGFEDYSEINISGSLLIPF